MSEGGRDAHRNGFSSGCSVRYDDGGSWFAPLLRGVDAWGAISDSRVSTLGMEGVGRVGVNSATLPYAPNR